MTDDLIAFLIARLDEDEAVAREAARCDGAWPHGQWTPEHFAPAELPAEVETHIARHDPARVLREVAAKRAILSMFLDAFGNRLNMTIYGAVGGFTMNGDWVLRQMAAIYSDHPDYPKD